MLAQRRCNNNQPTRASNAVTDLDQSGSKVVQSLTEVAIATEFVVENEEISRGTAELQETYSCPPEVSD